MMAICIYSPKNLMFVIFLSKSLTILLTQNFKWGCDNIGMVGSLKQAEVFDGLFLMNE